MNARRKRRRELERWRSEKSWWPNGLSPWAAVCDAIRIVGSALVEFGRAMIGVARAFAACFQPIIEATIQLAKLAPMDDTPGQPMTIKELYASLGSDGASEQRARFTGEGGFTLN